MEIRRTVCRRVPIIIALLVILCIWPVRRLMNLRNDQIGYIEMYKTEATHLIVKDLFTPSNENEAEIIPTNQIKLADRTNTFIFAQMRTGSSFVGEIFNQHPGSFYLFEPLWAAQNYNNGIYNTPKWRYKLLQGVATCQFEGLEDIMEYLLSSPIFGEPKRSQSLARLCRLVHSVISPHCHFPRKVMTSVLNEACRTSRLNVAKIGRIGDINFFKEIVENVSDSGRKVNIIHLVRDPRAVIASQISVFLNQDKTPPFSDDLVDQNSTRNLCRQMVNNAQTEDGIMEWLSGHYALIRYEDVAMTPVTMTKKLYYFIGAPYDNAVFDWLKANTNVLKPAQDPFSLKRNSRETVDAWRLKLSLSAVQKIQNVCRDALKMFGYRTVQDEAGLTNLSLSLVDGVQKDLVQIS